jgi:hypothetical protein
MGLIGDELRLVGLASSALPMRDHQLPVLSLSKEPNGLRLKT